MKKHHRGIIFCVVYVWPISSLSMNIFSLLLSLPRSFIHFTSLFFHGFFSSSSAGFLRSRCISITSGACKWPEMVHRRCTVAANMPLCAERNVRNDGKYTVSLICDDERKWTKTEVAARKSEDDEDERIKKPTTRSVMMKISPFRCCKTYTYFFLLASLELFVAFTEREARKREKK